jgi:hypothetical protein
MFPELHALVLPDVQDEEVMHRLLADALEYAG